MQSLKSSVASTSTNRDFSSDHAAALRSSWIRRLGHNLERQPSPHHLHPRVPHPYHHHRRRLFPPPSPPPQQPPPHLLVGFGPFRFHWNNHDRALPLPDTHPHRAGVCMSPFFRSQPQLTDAPSRSRPQEYLSEEPWRSEGSRAANYQESLNTVAEAAGNLTHSTIVHQPHRQTPVLLNEPEEPFSYWNMGRIKQTNNISSASTAIALAGNHGRKRDLNAVAFITSKSRRLDGKDL